MYVSTGILRYSPVTNSCPSLRVDIDHGIIGYYRSLVPKHIQLNKQKHDPHISVVRKEQPPLMEYWGKHEGETVEFVYDGLLQFGSVYCWLDVWSLPLEAIRTELGLPIRSPFVVPPAGYTHCFHFSVGNVKNTGTIFDNVREPLM